MTRKQRRLVLVLLAMLALGAAAALVLTAFQDNIVYFYSPTQLVEKHPVGRNLRIGGLVQEGSVVKEGSNVRFKITDLSHDVLVSYTGILPDLFREKQGVVVEGKLVEDGTFAASNVLAKHDENYMPKEVADSLKASGRWQGQGQGKPEAQSQSQAGGAAK